MLADGDRGAQRYRGCRNRSRINDQHNLCCLLFCFIFLVLFFLCYSPSNHLLIMRWMPALRREQMNISPDSVWEPSTKETNTKKGCNPEWDPQIPLDCASSHVQPPKPETTSAPCPVSDPCSHKHTLPFIPIVLLLVILVQLMLPSGPFWH